MPNTNYMSHKPVSDCFVFNPEIKCSPAKALGHILLTDQPAYVNISCDDL